MNRVVIPTLDAVSGTQLAGCLRSLEESQWYSAEELRALQDEKLRAVVVHAYETVPFYRELMDQRKLTPQDIRTTDDLPKLPVVTKRMMKDITPEKTVSSRYDVRRLVPRKTSGSTGEPFRFYVSKQEKIMKRAALARFWRWGGWDFGVRYVHLFSNPSSMFRRDGFLRSAEGFLMGRKFLCVKSLVPEHLDEIAAFGPKILFGYASGVVCLANFALDRGFKLDLKGILTTSENLTPHYRNRIEKAFSVKVLDEYGGEDMSFMAQCEHADLYHGNAETTVVELLKDGERVPAGESGEVVVTDLTRRAMPFIRYAMDDVAVGSTRRCPCGRGLPTYERIEGRNLDVLVASSGRKIPTTIVSYALDFSELKFYQAVQTQPDVLVVRIVPDKGFNSQTMDKLQENLKKWVGPEFQFQVEVVDDIQRTAAGKCRVISVEMANGCS
jgi:phenylacetate-CoA ligase